MPSATGDVLIDRSPEVVFAYLADAANDRAWRPGVLEIALVSGAGVGTRYRQVVGGPGGRRVDADIEITACEPPTRLAFRTISGPVRPTGGYVLEDVDGATRVRLTLSVELTGLKKALSPMVSRTMATEVGNLANLKRVLEDAA
ncbi:MAG: hypothetical protein QOJ35_2802 [Solirubrobacteraceae bacterium]|jgi:uncharacterized protein YndB with AHSA1/START domain|nr:hypothetical protein [Solirubrobacteraceae bacterium]